MKYILRFSPEITIKSKSVRKLCVKKLIRNIKVHLEFNNIDDYILTGNRDYINIETKITDVKDILLNIPGIEYFQEVLSFDLANFDSKENLYDFIYSKSESYSLDKINNKSFCLRVKRAGNHDFTSIEVERFVGARFLKNSINSKVSLNNPDYTINLEIKDNKLYVVKEKYRAIGGYPVGFQDKVISLISGGFDSGVATYSMIKRGVDVDYLFFNLGGNAHELGVKQVSYYLWKTFSPGYKKAKFITVPFEEVVKNLLENVNHSYRGVLLKRYMLKIASQYAKNYRHYAIIKGDSLGQVSSQTLKNMHVVDKASDCLVLRPLISDNKQEIIDISKKIGTYHFACNMPEYCGVISDRPSIGADLEDILEEEKNIENSVLERAYDNRKVEFIGKFLEEYKSSDEQSLETVILPINNSIVVDLREKDLIIKKPLKLEGVEVLNIPFFDINHKFENLDMDKIYLFYCDKGVLSSLHGLYLKDKGFNNIKIYRPI